MKEQLDILVKLQKIETEAAGIRSMTDGISEKLNALDAKSNRLEKKMARENTSLDDMRKTYRSHESDVKTNFAEIGKKQGNLAGVKTNREYQALLKEIQELKKKTSQLEDDMLKHLDSIEKAEKNVVTKNNEFEQLKENLREEKESIRKDAEQGEKNLDRLNEERDLLSKKVPPGLLKRFLMIRELKGMGIAAVTDFICQGCNMNIPPQLYNELHHCNSLQFCPHCERIIYWEKREE